MSNSLRNKPKTRSSGVVKTGTTPSYIVWILIAFMLSSIVVLLVLLFNNQAASLSSVESDLERLGKVVSHEPVPDSSMTAWVVNLKETGQPTLIYTTRDGKTIASGELFDVKSGNQITAKIQEAFYKIAGQPTDAPAASAAASSAQPGEPDLTPGQALGEWEGETPAVFTDTLELLGGFKEDPSVSPANTVYIIYDPRCPYCHEMFEVSRNIDLKAKGLTIKWLPTVALGVSGEDDPVIGQAAYGLDAKTPAEFALSFTAAKGNKPTVGKVTDAHQTALDANLELLYAASDQTFPGQPKSVPAAFYLDKRNGQPRMVYGPQQPAILKSIFGE
ncbi:hypothetical protein [Psychrobacter sp. UBA3480]|uniref:hypothetical protein n=1 Tax=Psychrobacter sp. UBA3480 TaxID=1947350 RepID=UPI0025F6A7C5|nr:hypothetical protein [Psychrobacter sp. UBA3480]